MAPALPNRINIFIIYLAWGLCATGTLRAQPGPPLSINELMAGNASTHADAFGEFDDWVELYNAGDEPVDVAGLYVTDDPQEPTKWRVPALDAESTTLVPGGYLVLWFDDQPEQGPLHVGMRLSRDGEYVGLYDADGATFIDEMTFPRQRTDMSYGRAAGDEAAWHFFAEPTPGAPNAGGRPGFSAPPSVSHERGFYDGGLTLSLYAETAGAIYYTIDGSDPAAPGATEYSGPFLIDTTTVVRAVAVEEGLYPSAPVTHTYLVDEHYALPVLAISTPPANLWDPATGIYANPFQRWERAAFAEFFEADGTEELVQPTGLRIYGGYTRNYDKKSFTLRARPQYGVPEIRYRMFESKPFDVFDGFIIRGYPYQHIRNPVVYEVYRQADSDIDVQAYRPAIVLLNGQYWGIYQIMERKDESFVLNNHGTEDIDMLGVNEVIAGDADDYNALIDFLMSAGVAEASVYEEIQRCIDLDNHIDFWIMEIHTSKIDNQKNARYWRPRTPEGRWRWISFDMDYMESVEENTLARIARIGLNYGNERGMLLGTLLQNTTFRDAFVNRYADLMNTVLRPENTRHIIDSLEAILRPDIGDEMRRWNPGERDLAWWEEWVDDYVRSFYAERPAHVRQHIAAQFDLDGTAALTLKIEPEEAGRVRLNTITVDTSGWSGLYFQGVPVSLSAEANPGYRLASWSDADAGADRRLLLTQDTVITVHFAPGEAAEDDVIINEINYHPSADLDTEDWVELYNRGAYAVDFSEWILKDSDDEHSFAVPDGTVLQPEHFLALSRQTDAFRAIFPDVRGVVGPFSFGFSSDGESVRLYNASGALINQVVYSNTAPWSSSADGGGHTLELIDPALDNAMAENWRASLERGGSPGRANGTVSPVAEAPVVMSFVLEQNYPNPFRTRTTITFTVPAPQHVTLQVYDVLGRKVATPVAGWHEAGSYSIPFDGKGLASGLYWYRLEGQEHTATRQMMLTK